MSFVITIPGADFSSNSIGTLLPSLPAGLPAGVSAAHLLLGGVTDSRVNLADPEGPTASWVGLPSFGSNGAGMSATAYLQPTPLESDDITVMQFLYSASGSGNNAIIAGNGIPGTSGFSIGANSDDQVFLAFHVKTSGGAAEFTNTNSLSKPAIFASPAHLRAVSVTINSTERLGRITAHGSGGGTQSIGYASGELRVTNTNPILVGSVGASTFAFVAIWPRALSQAEETAAYAAIKTWLAGKGVSVI
jgi:hypothetical protein